MLFNKNEQTILYAYRYFILHKCTTQYFFVNFHINNALHRALLHYHNPNSPLNHPKNCQTFLLLHLALLKVKIFVLIFFYRCICGVLMKKTCIINYLLFENCIMFLFWCKYSKYIYSGLTKYLLHDILYRCVWVTSVNYP